MCCGGSVAASRVTGHDRKTIRRYVATAVELGWQLECEEPAEQLAVQVAERLRPVAEPSGLGETERRLLPYRAKIKAWLRPVGESGGVLTSAPFRAGLPRRPGQAISDCRL